MRFYLCITLLVLWGGLQQVTAQKKFFTRNGHVSFFSKAPLENIEAHNKQAACVIDFGSGDVVFQILMRSFEFDKALMQEHFNENYVESDKYPKAILKGKIKDPEKVNLKKEATYPITIVGKMTLHGVTKEVTEKGTAEVKGGKVYLKSKFSIELEEYKVKIPKVVNNKIAETVQVSLKMTCSSYKK